LLLKLFGEFVKAELLLADGLILFDKCLVLVLDLLLVKLD
jgi:hypothetical protein